MGNAVQPGSRAPRGVDIPSARLVMPLLPESDGRAGLPGRPWLTMARRIAGSGRAGAATGDRPDPSRRSGWRCLALIEVINFLPIRRRHGVAAGERLALAIADATAHALPGARTAVVGRATIEITIDADQSTRFATGLAAIRDRLGRTIDLAGDRVAIELAIGGAVAPLGDADGVDLAEAAEAALADARPGAGLIVLDLSQDPSFDGGSLHRDLALAVARDEMVLHYQPKVNVRKEAVVSAEALIRWQHPERGLIPPGTFIPLAERSGDITALTAWTLRQVIADQPMTLFLNIAGQLLTHQGFVAEACGLVRESGARIGFEITETSVIRDPATAIANLRAFANIGIVIAIDDYGAGLSSLAYLKQLPARELKIDKLFVTRLASSHRDPLIVRSTIDLAHALDMEVTAEGVETPSALALLGVMGCDMVQGFLISRPLPLDAFIRFVTEDRHRVAWAEPQTSFSRPSSFWKTR